MSVLIANVIDRKKKLETSFSRAGTMGGSWPAGQRSGPADLDAARLWQRDTRDGGRSLSVLRPDSLVRCSALARLLSLPHSCLHLVMAGWVQACSTAP